MNKGCVAPDAFVRGERWRLKLFATAGRNQPLALVASLLGADEGVRPYIKPLLSDVI